MQKAKVQKKPVSLIVLLAALAAGGQAGAASQNITASIGFDTPLTLIKNSDIDFGAVVAGVSDSYTINTAGAVAAAGPGSWLAGPTVVGNITIAGSTAQAVTITVGGYTANGGVTPSNATCSYDGGAAGPCAISGAAPGAGKTLLLGVRANVNGTQASGSAATPSFTVTVAYQ